MSGTAIILYRNKRSSEYVAFVDEEDAAAVMRVHRWRLHKSPGSLTWYARGSIDGVPISLHRFILRHELAQAVGKVEVDHIDGDGLNNRRSNLRIVSHRINIKAGFARRAYDAWKKHEAETKFPK